MVVLFLLWLFSHTHLSLANYICHCISLSISVVGIEDITYDCAWIWILTSSVQLDMGTSEMSRWIREDKFISTSGHVMRRFWRFSEDLQPLSEDFQRFFKIVPKEKRTLPNIFRRLLKISEDNRIFSRRDWRCFDHTATHLGTFLRDYETIAMVIILVTVATPLNILTYER